MPKQITLHLHKNEGEPQVFSRSFIPWKLMKEAVKIASTLQNSGDLTDEQVDALGGLVVAVFGDQFSLEDLQNYADLGEVIQVITEVVQKANESSVQVPKNPTRAG